MNRLALICGLALWGTGHCATVFVSPTGSNEPPYGTADTAAFSIQTAIDWGVADDVVFVLAGAYREKVCLDKALILAGEGRDVCTLANPDPSSRFDNDTLVVTSDAVVQGLTVTGGYHAVVLDAEQPLLMDCRLAGAAVGVSCRSGFPTIALCEVAKNACDGVRAESSASPSILQCNVSRNGTAVYCDWGASPLISGCIIKGNRGRGITIEGPSGAIEHSLLVFNGSGMRFGMDYDCAGVISRSTIALNGHWGSALLDSRAVLDRCIVWSPPFGGIRGYVQPTNVTRTLANHADFGSPGVLVTDQPGFVGWGSFNNTNNPIHVDASAEPGGDGTKERPFRSIREAFWSFDFRLAADSPAVSAFGYDPGYPVQPIGYYADEPLAEKSGSLAVTITVAPGTYVEPKMELPEGCDVVGDGSSRPVLQPDDRPEHGEMSRVSMWRGTLRRLTLDGYGAYCTEGTVADCEFSGAELGAEGTEVTGCRFTGQGAKLWLRGAQSTVRNCVFHGIHSTAVDILTEIAEPVVRNCTFHHCTTAIYVNNSPPSLPPIVINSVFSQNSLDLDSYVSVPVSYSLLSTSDPGEGNIVGDPLFLDPGDGVFRLLPASPCIDAGSNDPELPETDIAGMHRIMYGGKSLTVDMGAYEFYINEVEAVPGTHETIFTWSSLADKTYSIFYSPDLLTWHLAIDDFPSVGNETSSWIDDGSLTGVPPSLAPRRFYRILENP